jgi:hypothetical protein
MTTYQTSSHREAPELLSPSPPPEFLSPPPPPEFLSPPPPPAFLSSPLPAEQTVPQHAINLNEQNCSHKTDKALKCKVDPDYISKLSAACLRSLRHILQDTDSRLLQKRELNILRRAIGAFILWDDGYGAQRGILDEKLKCSKQLYHTTLSLLHSLCKSAQYGKYLSRVATQWY